MTESSGYHNSLVKALRSSDVSLTGAVQNWAASVAVFDSKEGFGEEVWGMEQTTTTLAWRLAGCDVISELPGFRGARTSGQDRKVNLQAVGTPNRYRASGRIKFCHFYISDGLLDRVAEGMDLAAMNSAMLRPDLIMFRDEQLWQYLNAYSDRSTDSLQPPSRVEMEARALLIVEHLVKGYHVNRPAAPVRGGLSSSQLRRTREAMEANLDGDIGLDALARIAGCSPAHFCRAFRQSTGMPPFRWMGMRRIERAKDLLADPRLSLSEIALAVGYSAQPQFTTAFSRATGLTPGRWRRERLG